MADLLHLEMLYKMGYRRFMLSDGLCFRQSAFAKAMEIWADMIKHWNRAR